MSAHVSVLLEESLKALNIREGLTYVDATFGRGGHSKGILAQLGKSGKLIGIDRDIAAKKYARETFKESNFTFVHGAMSEMEKKLCELNIEKVDGILMDIGVSSPQLDDETRGFSFMNDGPLDMRMNQEDSMSAKEWVMNTSLDEMISVFKENGEERFSTRIANEVVKRRQVSPINTTFELVEIIREAIPFEDPKKHPATRVFQAIRIAVNRELEELELALKASLNLLNRRGRLVVITFHSLEDRIVKNFIREESKEKDLFPDLPVLIKGEAPKLKIIGKPIKPDFDEQERNIRARSATLRVAERL